MIERRAEVKCHIATDSEDIGLMIEDVCNLCVPQQRLRRNAADVVADTTPVLQLDDRSLQAKLSGTDGRNITAWSGAKHDNLKVRGHEIARTSQRCSARWRNVVMAPTLGCSLGGGQWACYGRGPSPNDYFYGR